MTPFFRATKALLRGVVQLSAHRHSSYSAVPRKSLIDLQKQYLDKEPLAVVTAWDYISGRVAESARTDITLVGDSLAMVALGYENTNEIEFEEFLYHVRAVSRGNTLAFIVADMPFGTFERSHEQAVSTAIQLVKKGKVQGVKIEGGRELTDLIKRVVSVGIPVMGHVGLTPQKHNTLGGYRLQGNSFDRAKEILEDCWALQEAGAFGLVLECIPNKLAEIITENLTIPTIGIGAGPHCSGQVLVMADLLLMPDPAVSRRAKFVKTYMNFFEDATSAVKRYKTEVKNGGFPDANEHGYKMKSSVLQELKDWVKTDTRGHKK